jgi:ribosomal protein S18 acetylase RimI-like enzyme
VSSFNHGARRLYERLGYREVGELANYIVEGYSEILLRKTRGPLTTYTPETRR